MPGASFNHVGQCVSDLERSKRFYVEVFGFEVARELRPPDEGSAALLRIFCGEEDRCEGQPLYEAIVLKARENGLAGATVLRGVMGYGKHSILHTAKILRLSEDLPMVVEIVDSADKVNAFLPVLEQMIKDGLVTLERVKVLHYQA